MIDIKKEAKKLWQSICDHKYSLTYLLIIILVSDKIKLKHAVGLYLLSIWVVFYCIEAMLNHRNK